MNVTTSLISSINVITVSEDRSKVALALTPYVMVIIMVLSPTIEWYELSWTEREIKPVYFWNKETKNVGSISSNFKQL
jgi:hypothetical protein